LTPEQIYRADLSRRVKAARKAHGWTQRALAYHAKIGTRSVYRFEAGEDVNWSTVVKILAVLRVEPTMGEER